MQKIGFSKRKPNVRHISGVFWRFPAVFPLLFLFLTLSVLLLGCADGEGEREISYPGYAQAENYIACSEFRFISAGIRKIDIDWIDGEIHLVQGTSSTFAVRETSAGLSNEQKMHYFQEDGVLHIRYCASGYTGKISGSEKHLTVEIPKSVSMEINCISADIDCDGLSLASRFDVKSVSGGVSLTGLDVSFASVDTVSGGILLSDSEISTDLTLSSLSGDIRLDSLSAGFLDAKTVTGDIFAETADCRDLSVESVSGGVTLSLAAWKEEADSGDPPGMRGYALEFQTGLGRIVTDLPYVKEGAKLYFGGGPDDLEELEICYAQVITESGDLTVK